MANESLRGELENLHNELSNLEGLDAPTLESLKKVAEDIDKLLSQQQQAGEEEQHELQGIREHLDDLAIRFDTEHPQIAGLLARLTDALGNIGI